MRVLIAVLVALNFFSFSIAHAGDVKHNFKLATGEYSPFTSEDLPNYGIDSHIIVEAFDNVDIDVIFDFLPWKRAFRTAEIGEAEGSLPWAKRDGREKLFYYSDPVIEVEREYFFYLKSTIFEWDSVKQDYSQLAGKRFSAIASGNYGDDFQNAEADDTINVTRLQEEKQSLALLFSGRVDILIGKKRVVEYALNKHFSAQQRSKITYQPESGAPPSFDYLLISKASPNGEFFLAKFNEGLKILHDSGRYEILMHAFEDGIYSGF